MSCENPIKFFIILLGFQVDEKQNRVRVQYLGIGRSLPFEWYSYKFRTNTPAFLNWPKCNFKIFVVGKI